MERYKTRVRIVIALFNEPIVIEREMMTSFSPLARSLTIVALLSNWAKIWVYTNGRSIARLVYLFNILISTIKWKRKERNHFFFLFFFYFFRLKSVWSWIFKKYLCFLPFLEFWNCIYLLLLLLFIIEWTRGKVS